MYYKLKERVFEILDIPKENDKTSKYFDVFIFVLIIINVLAVIIESVEAVEEKYQLFFYYLELFSIIIFTVEYILRLWSCTEYHKYRHFIIGRILFILSPLALVDLFAILPFYLPMIFKVDLRFLRMLRIIRLLRIIKVARYSQSMRILGNVFIRKKEELFVTIFFCFLLMVCVSCIMFVVEHDSNPKNFSSIPQTMFWSAATLTTIGSENIQPVTPLGKVLSSIFAFLGIGMFALPTGILGAGFVEEIERQKKEKFRLKKCPYCGKEIEM